MTHLLGSREALRAFVCRFCSLPGFITLILSFVYIEMNVNCNFKQVMMFLGYPQFKSCDQCDNFCLNYVTSI